jgi:DNA-binding MurR/RpiR family transcriptional regulator
MRDPLTDRLDYPALVELLKERRASLPPRLQDVAQFVLNNPEDVAILTIVEIARGAGVPPSAITRFTQELGFERFSDLQAVFRSRLVGPRLNYADRLKGISDKAADGDLDLSDPQGVLEVFASSAYRSLSGMVEDQREAPLRAVVEAIRAAPAVHVTGGRGAFGVAAYSFYGLAAVGKRAFLIDHLGAMRVQQVQAVGPEDVILAISFDDYTRETIETAELAAAAGRTILAITDNELSPLVPLARHALFVKEARLGHFRSQVPAMVLCQAIIASVGRSGGPDGERQIGRL